MEDLTKTQIILLVLLVSFVTSLVTGIVTVTLVNQAPPPVTQTINKVIEKTIETVTLENPEPSTQTATVVQPVVITQEDLVVQIVKDISPAVVSVIATKDLPVVEQYFVNPFDGDSFFDSLPQGLVPDIQIPQYRQRGTETKKVSSGTGFFISDDGLIITNKHVVEDTEAEYSIMTNGGESMDAEVVALDPMNDVAVLKIASSTQDKFEYIPLGNSDEVKVGQTVIAIGNTLGEFQNTVSIGIVSGLNRNLVASGSLSGPEELQELIQTDAAINQGNSGGPLLDLEGRVVGINTAVAKVAENVGFALPINIIKRTVRDVKEFGEITYPYVGVRYQVVDENIQKEKDLAVDYGLLLKHGPNSEAPVTKDGPADKAGLEEGDIITEFDNVKLTNADIFLTMLNNKRVGDDIWLKILRGEEELIIKVTLEKRPKGL